MSLIKNKGKLACFHNPEQIWDKMLLTGQKPINYGADWFQEMKN